MRPASSSRALYDELHRLARRELRPALRVRPSARRRCCTRPISTWPAATRSAFPDRARFIAYAARAMRGADHRPRRARPRAEARRRVRHHVARHRRSPRASPSAGELADSRRRARRARRGRARRSRSVVDLKFFCGFSFAEIAAMRGVSERTVQRQWEKARASTCIAASRLRRLALADGRSLDRRALAAASARCSTSCSTSTPASARARLARSARRRPGARRRAASRCSREHDARSRRPVPRRQRAAAGPTRRPRRPDASAPTRSIAPIGHGGMGSVWLARAQRRPLRGRGRDQVPATSR